MLLVGLVLVAGCLLGRPPLKADVPIVALSDQEFKSAIKPWTSGLPPMRFGVSSGGRQAYAGDAEDRAEAGPLGSVTKCVFASVALRLQAQGKISLGARLISFGITTPGAESVTLRQLLNHTSGYPECMYGFDPRLPFDRVKLMSLIRSAAARQSNIGTFSYSNTNYALLGMALESASGMDADRLIGKEVNGPVGVDFKTARLPDFDLNWYGGAGSLTGRAEDVAKFGEALSTEKSTLLGPNERRLMRSSTVPMGSGSQYGLGIIVAHLAVVPSASHAGEVPAALPYSCFLGATLSPVEPAGFAVEFRGDVMDQKVLNSIYGAYASACALLEGKRWIAMLATSADSSGLTALSSANRLSADAVVALSDANLRRRVHLLGPNPVLNVTSEIVRMGRVEMTLVARGENSSLTVNFRFGPDLKLESFKVSNAL